MFGGLDQDFLGDTWFFDKSSHNWVKKSSPQNPAERRLHGMVARNSKEALLFGGENGSGRLNDLWLWNHNESSWTLVQTNGPQPEPRAGFVFLKGSTNIAYLFGGYNQAGSYLNDLWFLNLETLEWSRKELQGTVLPGIIHAAGTVAGDSFLIIHGGLTPNGEQTSLYTVNLTTFNASGEAIGLGSPIPSPRRYHYMGDNSEGLYSLLIGGYVTRRNLLESWFYFPENQSWQNANVETPSFHGFSIAELAPHQFLVFGGNRSLIVGQNLQETWLITVTNP